MDSTEVISKLRSPDPEQRVLALGMVKTLLTDLCEEAARALMSKSHNYVIAERICALGPAVVPALERLLREETEPEPLAYAALVLLKLGSRAGTKQLLDSLENGFGPTGAIADSLSRTGMPEAAAAITQALRCWPVRRDPHTAATMALALKRLNAPIPPEILSAIAEVAPALRKLL